MKAPLCAGVTCSRSAVRKAACRREGVRRRMAGRGLRPSQGCSTQARMCPRDQGPETWGQYCFPVGVVPARELRGPPLI